MDNTGATLGTQHNTEVSKAFVYMGQQGWANESCGEDDFGKSVWLFVIEPNETKEITEAFDNDLQVTVYPGAYIAELDSDGNKTVTEYLANVTAISTFREIQSDYYSWCAEGTDDTETITQSDLDNLSEDSEKLYIVVGCGEAFDEIKIAYEHMGDCTDCFNASKMVFIVPESEAF